MWRHLAAFARRQVEPSIPCKSFSPFRKLLNRSSSFRPSIPRATTFHGPSQRSQRHRSFLYRQVRTARKGSIQSRGCFPQSSLLMLPTCWTLSSPIYRTTCESMFLNLWPSLQSGKSHLLPTNLRKCFRRLTRSRRFKQLMCSSHIEKSCSLKTVQYLKCHNFDKERFIKIISMSPSRSNRHNNGRSIIIFRHTASCVRSENLNF